MILGFEFEFEFGDDDWIVFLGIIYGYYKDTIMMFFERDFNFDDHTL